MLNMRQENSSGRITVLFSTLALLSMGITVGFGACLYKLDENKEENKEEFTRPKAMLILGSIFALIFLLGINLVYDTKRNN